MSKAKSPVNRRDFMKSAAALGVTLGAARSIRPQSGSKASPTRVFGANDKINVAVIGVGSRGSFDAGTVVGVGETSGAKLVAVCDVYEKHKRMSAERNK